MPFNLTRWQRFVRFWSYCLNPWRRCMYCDKRFFNRDFWRYRNSPDDGAEYCSGECAEYELESFDRNWFCGCGEYVEGDHHCPRCQGEPPWGCGGCATCDLMDEYDDEYYYELWEEDQEP